LPTAAVEQMIASLTRVGQDLARVLPADTWELLHASLEDLAGCMRAVVETQHRAMHRGNSHG
jgi:hypothetical protein